MLPSHDRPFEHPQRIAAEQWDAMVSASSLSPREAQVAVGIVDGIADKSIARALGISVHTVQTHKRRLFRKLGVTRQEAVAFRLLANFLDGQRDFLR